MCKQVFSFPTRFLQQSTANFHSKDFVSGKDFDNALQHMTVGKDNLGLFDTLAQLEKLLSNNQEALLKHGTFNTVKNVSQLTMLTKDESITFHWWSAPAIFFMVESRAGGPTSTRVRRAEGDALLRSIVASLTISTVIICLTSHSPAAHQWVSL
jgi:hypothetical protein